MRKPRKFQLNGKRVALGVVLSAAISAGCGGGTGPPPDPGPPSGLFVNGRELGVNEIAAIERDFNVRIVEGEISDADLDVIEFLYGVRISNHRFWYDPQTGLWGYEGLYTMGQIPTGIPAAPLPEDASNGDTGVFLNGRELHWVEVQAIERTLGVPVPGRYFIRANGDYGVEGGPVLGNLLPPPGTGGGGSGGGSSGVIHSSDPSSYGTVYVDSGFVGFMSGSTSFTSG